MVSAAVEGWTSLAVEAGEHGLAVLIVLTASTPPQSRPSPRAVRASPGSTTARAHSLEEKRGP